jgi:NADH-quinone oxidoreductase subunit G
MPKLTIDHRSVEVPAGTKVIEAAERLGIVIPRFCYHPALGSVGACRVCAVQFVDGPLKGVHMSCMVDARDGMVVETGAPEAVDFRRQVIEWLMLHHPHDCPVCDEGGHCLLQDLTVAGGHGRRRYRGLKRTYPDQDLGPLVQHEMNRCIHCYRCVRYYQEVTGYRDLGVLQIANRTYFGRRRSGTLSSPFAGNLIDLCPTGVYTDKPSRFRGRRWDFERAPGVCLHCSLGCHTLVSCRYREVVRLEARFSAVVNGWFLCDRGRYGFAYANLPERPRAPRVSGAPADVAQALEEARRRLAALRPAAVALMVGPRSPLETLGALKQAARRRGWRPPLAVLPPVAAGPVARAAARLERDLAVSLGEVETADAILVAGADPLNEAPLLALALRQARRRGAALVVIDPRPVRLPCEFRHLPAAPADLPRSLAMVLRGALASEDLAAADAALRDWHAALPAAFPGSPEAEAAAMLAGGRRPLIVCGTATVDARLPDLAADGARLLQAAGRRAGLFFLLPGPNAYAAGQRPDGAAANLEALVAQIETGEVRALVAVEVDPRRHFPDPARLARALERLDLLAVLDHLDTPTGRQAHIFLPTATPFESGGAWVNQEGRLQAAPPAHAGGTPLAQVSGGSHPPRAYDAGLPGSDPRPAWDWLAGLCGDPLPDDLRAGRRDAWNRLADEAFFQYLPPDPGSLPEDGLRVLPEASPDAPRAWTPLPAPEPPSGEGLVILLTETTFGSEELSREAACLETLEPAAGLTVHPAEAARLGAAPGDPVVIDPQGAALTVPLTVDAATARGVGVLPRHRGIAWQPFEGGAAGWRRCLVRKIPQPAPAAEDP